MTARLSDLRLRETVAKTIGQQLRAARLARGLTQRAVSEASDIYRPLVARTEAGRHVGNFATLYRHASAVGLTLAELGHEVEMAIDAAERSTS